jgi:hypothetical protein
LVSTISSAISFSALKWTSMGLQPVPARELLAQRLERLFYAKAGGGWVGSDTLTITNTVTSASITGFTNNTTSGWLVGGGSNGHSRPIGRRRLSMTI